MARISKSRAKRSLPPLSDDEYRNGCKLGLDSHADVHCVGQHARIVDIFEGRSCTVHPFHDSYSPMRDINTVNACFAFDTSEGETYILHVNQALNFTDSMEHSLLCVNQARMHGVVVDDVPLFLDHHKRSTHSVYFPTEDVRLPLLMDGPTSCLPVRYPTDDEMEYCIHLELSCGETPWDPLSLNDLHHKSSQQYKRVSQASLQHIQVDIVQKMMDFVYVNAVHRSAPLSTMSPEKLSQLWNISLPAAKDTLRSCTLDSIRQLEKGFSRRVKTRAHQRQYKHLGGYLGEFHSDTFKMNVASTRGNKYAQLFTNHANFVQSYAMKKKEHAHHALDRFLHEVGVPHTILSDGAKELHLAKWGVTCRRHNIRQKVTEPHSLWQNHAKRSGGIVKRKLRRLMKTTNTPIRLWDYCWEYLCNIISLTASGHFLLDGVTPFEKVHGYTPDISELVQHKWFSWVWYHEPTDPSKAKLGLWLGPAYTSGQGLASLILTEKGKVKTRSTISPISPDELKSTEFLRRQQEFTTEMESHVGNFSKATTTSVDVFNENDPYALLFELDDAMDEEEIEPYEVDDAGNPIQVPSAENFNSSDAPFMEAQDAHIGLHVSLPSQGEIMHGVVKERIRNPDGTLKGTSNQNPILDTREYRVEFGDGSYQDYSANVLVENLYSQIDDNGTSFSLLKSIIGHRKKEDAIPISNGYITLPSGSRKRIITTRGWDMQVEWVDGTSSWIPLADIKESNPIEVAEYACAANIQQQPAFAWWTPTILKKRDRIVNKIIHRVPKKNLKFGVEVPGSVQEAYALDAKYGNTYWHDAIQKELKNIIVAFELLDDGEHIPAGSKRIPYHIIFDVKYDLTRKARLVAGGHQNKEPLRHVEYIEVLKKMT